MQKHNDFEPNIFTNTTIAAIAIIMVGGIGLACLVAFAYAVYNWIKL